MAYAMTKQGSLDNCITYEFICDTIQDMNAIENRYRTIGTVAIVLSGADEGLEVYMSGSNHEWVSLSSMGTSGGGATGGLSIYICAQNEVSNGLPNIQDPDETTIYLVASGNESGNLYEEYIYVDDAWEKFGSGGATIDLSGYAPIANPAFTGSISIGRTVNTEVGPYSVAEGDNVIASDVASHAEGSNTIASGSASHAEGSNTIASGVVTHAEGTGSSATAAAAHAEGFYTTASGEYSHAEGYGTTASGSLVSHAEGYQTAASGQYGAHAEGYYTLASNYCSHTEGYYTIASGGCSHAEGYETEAAGLGSHAGGMYNVPDSYDTFPEWISGTEYHVGDKVKITYLDSETSYTYTYECITDNNDETFDNSHWYCYYDRMKYAEIVGNGLDTDLKSNARALDWDGNEHLMGDIYVHCNANSTGGTKLIGLPTPPVSDGTYTLQLTITSGVPTYSWVALSSLSGVTF